MAIQIRCRFDPAWTSRPSDNLDLELRWEGKFERPNRSLTPIRKTPLTLFPDPVGDPFNPVTYLPTEEAFGSPYVVESTANILADLTTHGASFKSRWQFKDDWYLESITAYRSLSWDFVLDADSTPHPVLDIPVYEDADQFSTELRVAYESDSGRSFTGGVFYFNDHDIVLAGFDDASASFQFLGLFSRLSVSEFHRADTAKVTSARDRLQHLPTLLFPFRMRPAWRLAPATPMTKKRSSGAANFL